MSSIDLSFEVNLSKCESEESKSDNESSASTDSDTHLDKFVAIGSWGTHGVDQKSFCDQRSPFERFTKYRHLTLTEEEANGILTDRIIASCSSFLEICPLINKFVLGKAILSNKGLTDIDSLKYHHFLQYLDLSWNKLSNVSILEHLPFLIHLDLSHNKIEHLLNFHPPYNLTYANYSYNLIKKIPDLSKCTFLKSLNVSNNSISVIEGLSNLKYLETLDLSNNKIKIIENLDKLHIINLNLQHNKIFYFVCDQYKGFKTMPLLTYVRLGHNELSSLKIFENATFIQSIDMEDNNINNIVEISHLKDLNLLISVNFTRNPIRNCANYEMVCLETITKLRFLDNNPIGDHKKIHTKSSFTQCTKEQVSQDHANILTLSHLTKFPYLGLNVIPFDFPPRPVIIIVSLIGSKEEYLIKKFIQKYPQHALRLINHTDRGKMATESENDYWYVSPQEFLKLLENGEFLMMYTSLNDNYGLTQEEFARGVQEQGKVMIVKADLNAALAFRLRGFRPFIILAIPRSEEIHRQWLMETYETSVFNIRYPEAAIKIFNRETSIATLTPSTSTTNTFSTDLRLDAPQSTCNDYVDKIKEEETHYYYDDYERLFRKFFGMRNYGSDQYSDKINNTKLFSGSSAAMTDDENKFVYNYNSLELSGEGSTINFPEDLVQNFYSKVIHSRNMYFDFHLKNPGVFYDVVFTDELDSAMKKLKYVVKMALKTQLQESNFQKFDHNNICQSIIEQRLKICEDEIEKAMTRNVNCK